jgi:hypothetical protein
VWASRATVLGNPDIRPWEELREITDDVGYEEVQFETYYICRGRKPGRGKLPSNQTMELTANRRTADV